MSTLFSRTLLRRRGRLVGNSYLLKRHLAQRWAVRQGNSDKLFTLRAWRPFNFVQDRHGAMKIF
jgi:hypothetical protein